MKPTFRFLHCSDLHLDCPFTGLGNVDAEVARELYEATFSAFEEVERLAIEHDIDFILIAGDVYETEHASLRAEVRFRKVLERLTEKGIQVFIVHGNHDPLPMWKHGLKLPQGVHRFGAKVSRHRVIRDGIELADIYGISFPRADVRENLARHFQREDPHLFSIGLLHTNVGGEPEHDNYAPCTLEDLISAGMDYWALGHVHTYKILRQQNPMIVYSGTTQGRHIGETGPHGCVIVEVQGKDIVSFQFYETDKIRWEIIELHVQPDDTFETFLQTLETHITSLHTRNTSRPVLVRFLVHGRASFHRKLLHRDEREDLLGILREYGMGYEPWVWVESITFHTKPPIDINKRRQVPDVTGDFLTLVHKLRSSSHGPETIRKILLEHTGKTFLSHLVEKFPDEDLLKILDEAEQLGLDELLPEAYE